MNKRGKVYLVGAGPGEPGLITVKGLECLKKAEVVIHDRLINLKLLQYAPMNAEIIYCGKSPQKHTLTQEKINSLLVKKAREGKVVARLKCGDPFLFGRGAEEALYLSKHKIAFEIIPGVTTALAVPAYAGIPLTHRKYTSSVGIFTGHQDAAKDSSSIDWEKAACGLGTLVFLMGVENLSKIVNNLIQYGRPNSTPCCLIQAGTLSKQKSVLACLGTIVKAAQDAEIMPPAILVVGEVAALKAQLNWYESKPLLGKIILLTGPQEAGGENRLLKLLEDEGASCVESPAIEIRPLKNYTGLDTQIKKIDDFKWLIFTSQNGVKFFKQRLDYLKRDARILKGVKIAAIGQMTQIALENLGLKADLVAKQFCQEGLIKGFQKINLKKKNILIVSLPQAREVLPMVLRRLGAKVKVVFAYQTIPICYSALSAIRCLKDIDLITFTSASGVKNFFALLPKDAFQKLTRPPIIAAIGPVTSASARKLGLRVDIEAKQYTFKGLAEAIVKYYKKHAVNSG